MLRPSKQPCGCGKQKSQVAKTCFACKKINVNRVCTFCKKEYKRKPSKNKVYCSSRCRYDDKEANQRIHKKETNRVRFRCKYCNKECEVPASLERGGFCGLPCAYKFNSGENNSFWRGGTTPERQKFNLTPEWKEAVRSTWAKYEKKCRVCSMKYEDSKNIQFHIHHIKPFRYEKYRADLANLMLVCRPCHLWIHSNKNVKKEFIDDSE